MPAHAVSQTTPKTILVRAPNWLGDCVMALPVFRRLREAFPSATIIAACRAHLADCFSASPDIDEVVLCPSSGGVKTLLNLWQAGGALRGRNIDAGILLTNSFSSGLWLWRTGAKARIGFSRDGRGMFLTHRVFPTREILAAHQADYYLRLLSELNAPTTLDDPVLVVPESGRAEAASVTKGLGLPAGTKLIAMAPVSAYGPVKDWLPERYGEVAKRLYETGGWVTLVTGIAKDRERCEAICAVAGNGARNVAGMTGMSGFLGLMDAADAFVGGDSGGSHVAAALGKPTVAIFGITEPSRTHALGRFVKNVGRGGMVTPDLKDPLVRQQAQEALASVSVDDVCAAFGEACAAAGI